MATTFAEAKIRVNCIAPGLFPSEMTAGSSGDDQKSELKPESSNPAGRPGSDSDMAACILFLAGPGGVFLNGQAPMFVRVLGISWEAVYVDICKGGMHAIDRIFGNKQCGTVLQVHWQVSIEEHKALNGKVPQGSKLLSGMDLGLLKFP
ncbi:MAG: hypothetical protein Q9192_006607 [Flavoplaca navasiana]